MPGRSLSPTEKAAREVEKAERELAELKYWKTHASTLDRLIADAEAVLKHAKANPLYLRYVKDQPDNSQMATAK